MPLDKIQTNAMYRVIESNGVDPRVLVLAQEDDIALVEHRPSQSQFSIRHRERRDGLRPVFDIRQQIGGAAVFPKVAESFNVVLVDLKKWIGQVAQLIAAEADRRREQEEYEKLPDLWAELQRAPDILEAVDLAEADNAPFTAAERAEVSQRIEEVKKRVRKNPELTAEQISGIEAKLDDMVDASKRSAARTGASSSTGMRSA
jgi:hypothetical protein